jgi:hypothetical protein
MDPWMIAIVVTVALLAGLGVGYEIRDRRFIKEIRNEFRAEVAEGRHYFAKRIGDLEDRVSEEEDSGGGG